MDIVTLGAALNGSKKYTDTVAQSLMGGVRYQGEVNYYDDLPTNAEPGDAYTVKYSGTSGTDPDGTEYTWGLNHQTQQYTWIDFSKDSYTKTETDNLIDGLQRDISEQEYNQLPSSKNSDDTTYFVYDGQFDPISADEVDDTSSTNKFVTAADKTKLEKAVTTDDIGLGTDYFVYNGTRVYISATEPTGDIPDNSIWLGSGAAGVGIFTVTVTADSQDNLTSDKTYSEIMAAYTANQLIFVNWVNNLSSYTLASADGIPLSEINNNQMFEFTRSYAGDGEIVVMTISIRDNAIAPIVVTNETVSTV